MRLSASCSSAVRSTIGAPAAESEVLGRCGAAVYLRVASEMIALVTPDGLRLPCAVVVASLPAAGPVHVGDGAVTWPGVRVSVVREWAPATVRRVSPLPARVAALRAAVAHLGASDRLDVDSMIGRGAGLTPSDDDVLAGFLLGCRAFGRDPGPLPVAVRAAAHRTTDLSAALLLHAIAGRCLPEVAALVAALGGGELYGPLAALLRIGHTSGAALGHGLVLAANPPVGDLVQTRRRFPASLHKIARGARAHGPSARGASERTKART